MITLMHRFYLCASVVWSASSCLMYRELRVGSCSGTKYLHDLHISIFIAKLCLCCGRYCYNYNTLFLFQIKLMIA